LKFVKSILVAAAGCLLPLASYAAPVTSNPSLSINGLSFSGFACSISMNGPVSTPTACDQINVNTITNPGSGIQISSGFTAGPGSFNDAVIDYHVSSTSGINAVGLDFNGTFLGLAISSVTESVFSGGQQVGFATVTCGIAGCNRTDNIMLDGSYSDLYIEKDINVTGGIFTTAQISIIDQTFGTDAPEPASLALFGSGLLGAALLLRRRVKLDAGKTGTLA
jgi:hypothetical protein